MDGGAPAPGALAADPGAPADLFGEKKKKKRKGSGLPGAKKKKKDKKAKKKKKEPIQIRKSSSGTVVGDFSLGSELGKGGFGTVYMAMNTSTGAYVAVKQVYVAHVPKDELASIKMEIELLKRLRHDNIVRYIDSIEEGGTLNIVIEYVENGALASVVKKFGNFSEKLCLKYLVQVLEGLAYLHEQGVIHRDIKGANILTTKEGVVKLADFGVAINLDETANEGECVVGTPYWMAPEIIKMEGVTAKCDIWSVGCVVIELMTGKPPYFELAPMAALFRIVQDVGGPPLPNGISNALRDFLGACFKGTAELRKSAIELLEHPWCSAQISKLRRTRAASNSFSGISVGDNSAGSKMDVGRNESAVGDTMNRETDGFMDIIEGAAGNRGFISLDSTHITSRRGGSIDDLDALSDGSDWDDLEDSSQPNPPAPAAAPSLKQKLPSANERAAGGLDDDFGGSNGDSTHEDAISGNKAGPLTLPKQVHTESDADFNDDDWAMSDDDDDDASPSSDIVAKLKREAGKKERGAKAKSGLGRFVETQEDDGLDISGFSTLSLAKGAAAGDAVGQLDGFSDTDDDDDLDLAGFSLGNAQGITLGAGGLALAVTPMHPPSSQVEDNEADPFAFVDDDSDEDGDDFFGTGNDGDGLDFADEKNFEADAEAQAVGAQVGETYRLLKQIGEGDSKETRLAVSRLHDLVHRKNNKGSKTQQVRLTQLKKLLGAKGHEELLREVCKLVASETGLGPMYVQEMMAIRHPPTMCKVLEIMEETVHGDTVFQEMLALVGFIPRVVQIGMMTEEEGNRMNKELEEEDKEDDKTKDEDDQSSEEDQSSDEDEDEDEINEKRIRKAYKSNRDWRGALQKQAARIAHHFCKGNNATKKAFIACGGLPMIVDLLRLRYEDDEASDNSKKIKAGEEATIASRMAKAALEQRRTTVRLAVDAAGSVLTLNANAVNIHKNELCRLFAQAGMLPALTDRLLEMVRCAGEDTRLWHYVQHAAGLLDKFCLMGDVKVKARAVEPRVMKNVMEVIRMGIEISSEEENSKNVVAKAQMEVLLGKLLGSISSIAMVRAPAVITALQAAGVIPVLVSFLPEQGQSGASHQNIAMKGIYHLCRLSPPRQEEAALAGVVPRLHGLIANHFTLKQMAMKVFCDLAKASDGARDVLGRHGSLQVYLEYLEDRNWARGCITSLSMWLIKDIDNMPAERVSAEEEEPTTSRIENELLKPSALSRIVDLLCRPGLSKSPDFEAILEPLQGMLAKSAALSRALASEPRFVEEIAKRLDHKKAIVGRLLLKMLLSLVEHCTDGKSLVVQFDLYPKISARAKDKSKLIVSALAEKILQIAGLEAEEES